MAPLPLPQALSEFDDYDGHSLSASLTAEAAAHHQSQQRGKREGSVRSRVKSLTASLHRVSEVMEGGRRSSTCRGTNSSMGEIKDSGLAGLANFFAAPAEALRLEPPCKSAHCLAPMTLSCQPCWRDSVSLSSLLTPASTCFSAAQKGLELLPLDEDVAVRGDAALLPGEGSPVLQQQQGR